MKKCPTCGAVVEKNDYCQICSTCVIYEDIFTYTNYKPAFNKYFLFDYLKRLLLPVISLIVVVILSILMVNRWSLPVLIPIALSVLSVFNGIFEEQFIRLNLVRYNEEYARIQVRLTGIIESVFAIITIVFVFCAK